MKIAFYTLGCKTNQYETQAMERLLCEQGHEICSFEDDCDCYIVNTCSVTAVADKKNRAIIRRCRREHPQAILGVCGCYSQHAAQAVRELTRGLTRSSRMMRQLLPLLHETQPRMLAVSLEQLDTAVQVLEAGTSVRRLVVFDHHTDVDDERERIDAVRGNLAGIRAEEAWLLVLALRVLAPNGSSDSSPTRSTRDPRRPGTSAPARRGPG